MGNGRIGEQLGVWKLERLIGSGGMGDVYFARRNDGVVDQGAAVKVLRGAVNDDSAGEAALLQRMRHDNIARCLDCRLTGDGHRYLVMEYVEGKSITEYADQKGLSIHDRLDCFLDACEAIEYAHHRMIVHLDLKPANILVDRNGAVKIIDFGVARSLADRHTVESCEAFSGPYASPEQIQPGYTPGYAADIYALGTVLYELLCGHEPFNPSLAAGELQRRIVEEIPLRPSDAIKQTKLQRGDSGKYYRLDPETIARMRGGCRLSEAAKLISGDLDRVCLFALRKEVASRYRSIDDFSSDIKRVLEGAKPAIARSGDPIYSARRIARKKPLEIMAAIALLSAPAGTFSLARLFSNGIDGSLENTRQFDQAAEFGLQKLSQELRPKLTGNPRSRGSLDALDTVLHTAMPLRSKRTLWDKIRDDLVLQRREFKRIIP